MSTVTIFMLMFFTALNERSALSFNRPKFCPTAAWSVKATTFANRTMLGTSNLPMFIDTNNTLYVANWRKREILVWFNGSYRPINITTSGLVLSNSLFVTSNGDIYIDSIYGRVNKWVSNANAWVSVMNVNSSCYGLFIDVNNTLYCSMHYAHQVVKRGLTDSLMISNTVAAGIGTPGSAPHELHYPRGIFVDGNLDLYVADYANDRIQRFQSDDVEGITVAGKGAFNPTIALRHPSGIVLDADNYLFIVDSDQHRIVADGPHGFRCVVGCDTMGSQPHQLYLPSTFSFDSYGNIFVADEHNHRIQKFIFLDQSCAVSFNRPKFSLTATWNTTGTTFADRATIGWNPLSMFIDRTDVIYIPHRQNKEILVWANSSINPSKSIPVNLSNPHSIFAMNDGHLFVDNAAWYGRVEKWTPQTNTSVAVMQVNSSCWGLFVDIDDTLYCSLRYHHQVVKRRMRDSVIIPTIVAGTGVGGSASDELKLPRGIFVDESLDLYVADCENNRIQRFGPGESNGITLAGVASVHPSISLNRPTGLVIDAQKHLFIVDSGNHRILGPKAGDLRCLVGCDGKGSQSNQLFSPSSLSFDSLGNMFVTDSDNNRIQKYEMLPVVQSVFPVALTARSPTYLPGCISFRSYYEAIQVNVKTSGYYTFRSQGTMNTNGYLYENYFNSLSPSETFLAANYGNGFYNQFQMGLFLHADKTYVLVVATLYRREIGQRSIVALGANNVTLTHLTTPVIIHVNYSSELTVDSPSYYRDCRVPNYHYEALEISVIETGSYTLWSESAIDTFGYIYQNDFTPLQPFDNLLVQHGGTCNQGQLKFTIDLRVDEKHILVVTTNRPNKIGNFSIFISGPENVSVTQYNARHGGCVIGEGCHFYVRSIGLTLDDILRDELERNTTFSGQSFTIKISAALTIVMYVGSVINSVLSFVTFKNKDSQQVGCGMYLLASSLTSLLTMTMFTVKFWFVIVTHINGSTRLSVLRGGCVSIEPTLKLFLYLDTWLNTCVAVERAIHVFKGIKFDKKKSRHIARWLIIILPLCIMSTIVHEPLYRELFEYQTEINQASANTSKEHSHEIQESGVNERSTNERLTERHIWCITRYSPSVQDYNTAILFFHLVAPFLANLFSALFIICGAARQRSVARADRNFKEHVREQFDEHKRLIISPVLILTLSLPRLIISLLSGCLRTSENLWLYLSAYFISFTPSMLIFMIFVLPSELYMKVFKESFISGRRHTRQ